MVKQVAGVSASNFVVGMVCLLASSMALAASSRKATVIVTNARIYTVNAKQFWAEAVAISGDKILAVGSKRKIDLFLDKSTLVIDAHGKLVLPGFTDSHFHLIEGSRTLSQVNLNGAKSIAEVQKRVKDFVATHPNASWITGRGWSYEIFGDVALPHKKYLDEIVNDRPVYLVGFDGHTSWVNSKALAVTGITRDTPNPAHGTVVKDAKGEPTGALKEDADDLVGTQVRATREEQLAALRLGLRAANRAGLTRVICLGNSIGLVDDGKNIALYDELLKNGELTLRLYVSSYQGPPTMTNEQIAAVVQAKQRYQGDWLAAGAVKFYLDGVIESHTAAMLTPYSDDPTQIGVLRWDEGEYKRAVAELDKRGIQVFTHAIGDRAVRLALDAYEDAAKTNGTHDMRHRIEHIETITAQDIPRFGKLGVVASYQPLHAEPIVDTVNIWARNAGPDRASRGWTWQSVAKAGGRLAFGSDWPVVTLSPWYGIQTALTRQTLDGKPEGGWSPQERVSLEQAIEGYTLGAAFSAHRETQEGSLEEGKLADLIILDQDIFKIAPSEIHKTEVVLTMVGGKVVYQSSVMTTGAGVGSAK
jgi:predicted amidohydrolase YtcJ